MTCRPCRAKREDILRKYQQGNYSGAARSAVEGMLMLAGMIEKPNAQTDEPTTLLPDAKHDI